MGGERHLGSLIMRVRAYLQIFQNSSRSHTRKWRGEARMAVNGIGVTLTDQNFQTVVLESPQPVLVAFAVEGCGPWHLLAPEIAAIDGAFRSRVTVATLDVEAQPQTPERCGVGTFPAVLFFQDGRVVDQLSSMVDGADIAAKLHILTRNSHA